MLAIWIAWISCAKTCGDGPDCMYYPNLSMQMIRERREKISTAMHMIYLNECMRLCLGRVARNEPKDTCEEHSDQSWMKACQQCGSYGLPVDKDTLFHSM